jgi:hypothetical protein
MVAGKIEVSDYKPDYGDSMAYPSRNNKKMPDKVAVANRITQKPGENNTALPLSDPSESDLTLPRGLVECLEDIC